ncbi:hypothetical protein DRE_00380 [Drechslerella stenobrocha 248]|uniref:Uncharacterized protein n=1 Tax=Drechslerella stenobrocha 248 TaxID=1043628 RepID=W7I4N4_9PEZI|nr:hypothetical protein DRE_00380 [Drechslerella stenobrocha 248]
MASATEASPGESSPGGRHHHHQVHPQQLAKLAQLAQLCQQRSLAGGDASDPRREDEQGEEQQQQQQARCPCAKDVFVSGPREFECAQQESAIWIRARAEAAEAAGAAGGVPEKAAAGARLHDCFRPAQSDRAGAHQPHAAHGYG